MAVEHALLPHVGLRIIENVVAGALQRRAA